MTSPLQIVPYGYVEHAPPVDLAEHIACIWTSSRAPASVESYEHRVLPDGCVDLIFSFGDDLTAMAVGPMSRPIVVSGAGRALHVGVRFRPGRALAALGAPAGALLDDTNELEISNGRALPPLREGGAARPLGATVAAVADLVRERLRGSAAVPGTVRAAVARILVARGNMRIDVLAAKLGVTRQQLARQFAIHVGLSPKVFARVTRARAVIATVSRTSSAPDWTSVALSLGYYDQSHLVDDFKAITGWTPGEWRATSRPFPSPASMP